jgi:hypothetical protein
MKNITRGLLAGLFTFIVFVSGATVGNKILTADSPHESNCTHAHTDTAGSNICFNPGGVHQSRGTCRNSAGSVRRVRGPVVGEDRWSNVFCGRDAAGRQMFLVALDDRKFGFRVRR